MRQFRFQFQGQTVNWWYKEIYIETNHDIFKAQVLCHHPVFFEVEHSTTLVGTSFGYIIDKGKRFNRAFFSMMFESYMAQR